MVGGEPGDTAEEETPVPVITLANKQLGTARAMANQNPAAVASILRGWVNGQQN